MKKILTRIVMIFLCYTIPLEILIEGWKETKRQWLIMWNMYP